jgi:hypothetical protein
LCEHKIPFLLVIDKKKTSSNIKFPSFRKWTKKFCSVVMSWTSSSPDLQQQMHPPNNLLLLQGRSGPVQYVPSVCPSSPVNDFFPSLSFLFRHPPKGTDLIPGNKNTQHGQKAAARKELSKELFIFMCMDGQFFCCGVGWGGGGWC